MTIFARIKTWMMGCGRAIRLAYQTPIARYALELEMRPPKLHGMVLRAYRPEDFEACRLIYELNAPNRFPKEVSQEHEEYLRQPPEANLIVELDHQIIGCGGLILNHPDCASFVYGLVHPEYQQLGVGRLLFFGRIAILPPLEKDTFIFIATVKPALSYYERFGFILTDHSWKDESGCEHPSAVTAVNAAIIQKARDYLSRNEIDCPDMGILKPRSEELAVDVWKNLPPKNTDSSSLS